MLALPGYPPDHINAVITHTIHFLGLLTFYLGIKLPFDVAWTGGKLGVGQPWIRSIKGTELGSWAKYVIHSLVSIVFTYTFPDGLLNNVYTFLHPQLRLL
jgi:hypothetical protein